MVQPDVGHGVPDQAMIGLENGLQAALRLRRGQALVGGDQGLVRNFRHAGRMAGRPVEIDDQARVARQDRRGVQVFRKNPGDGLGADVIGDVAFEMLRLEAQVAERTRHPTAGVVARQDQGRSGVAANAHGRGRFVGGQERLSGIDGECVVHAANIAPPGPLGSHK